MVEEKEKKRREATEYRRKERQAIKKVHGERMGELKGQKEIRQWWRGKKR